MLTYPELVKLMLSGKMKLSFGEILFLGHPFSLMPMYFYEELTKRLIEDPEEREKVYFDAWKAGFKFTLDIVNKYSLESFEDRYKLAMDLVSMSGFGDYRTIEFFPGYAIFKIINNPFPKLFYPSNLKVDHILRGINAGGGTVVHERIINCVELECAAENSKYCLHVNGSQKYLEERIENEKILEEQLGDIKNLQKKQVSYLKRNYKKIYKKYSIEK